ncbi:MAG: helix-turn-helix domain-containing protein, partial [Actinobacteria bacterium]|nr:helix-turn-helix domain-containing protein [Actinomycetota bacterium]
MNSSYQSAASPAFYTVPEAARILRVTPATIYRAIRDDAFPAVRIRTRYVIP